MLYLVDCVFGDRYYESFRKKQEYLILVLIRKIDKKDKLSFLGEKTNLPVLFLLVIPVWGSAQILNTPLVEVYRNGVYIFVFLLGYYVLHYPLMVILVYGIDQLINGPAILYYVLTLVLEIVILPVVTEVIRRIPVVRGLLLGF